MKLLLYAVVIILFAWAAVIFVAGAVFSGAGFCS